MRPRLISPLTIRAAIASALFAGLCEEVARGADPPFGLEARVPWDGSRLVGSPEPPLPYTVEKTFTKQTWKAPIDVVDEPGTDRLWVIQLGADADKGYQVVRIKDDPSSGGSEVLLDVPNRLVYTVCFHPRYAENGFVYMFSNGPKDKEDRKNRVSRYTVGRQEPWKIDPKSEEVVLEWKSAGHDGGGLTFGLDGMLYVTAGDGTSDSDTWVSGQTLDDLLGSVLRIDVDRREGSKPYAIPPDNPFLKTPGACPEIWAYGLRNPWRMCTDPKNGNIWVGNNGQDLWETAYLIRRGDNYGWSVFEGSHPFYLERKRGPTPHVPPTIEHPHADFRSLTGGVVYRGTRYPDLDGAYLYGDYSSGRIWGMKHDGQNVLWHREVADTAILIAAFRVDQRGEILVVDNAGAIYRMIPRPKDKPSPPFPTLLSRTGLFSSTKEHRVERALIPYSVNAPGWIDGLLAERFMAIPGDAKVGFNASSAFTFPEGTALVQTLSIEREPGNTASRARVETRILLLQQAEWVGYTYRWNAGQTDATLVPKGGEDIELAPNGRDASGAPIRQKYRLPSRAECMACHSRAAGFVLGATGAQLNREHEYRAGLRDNQLRAIEHIGLFSAALPKPPKDLEAFVSPSDASKDLERRARTYLQVNCAVCHVEAGGGNAQMQLALATSREKMNLFGSRPLHDTFGITDAMLIAPGEPDRSVMLYRLSHRGRGQMPPLVSNKVDEGTVALFREWIATLKPEHAFVRAWTMDDLLPSLDGIKTGRSVNSGRKVFRSIGCIQCHRVEGEGGSVGPDLAGVGRRLKPNELLESILLPSKVIADEYADTLIETQDGTVVSGRVEREDDRVVVIRPPSAAEVVTIAKPDVAGRKKSDLSNMPLGIVNVLEKDQVLDLLAYLLSDPQPKKPEAR